MPATDEGAPVPNDDGPILNGTPPDMLPLPPPNVSQLTADVDVGGRNALSSSAKAEYLSAGTGGATDDVDEADEKFATKPVGLASDADDGPPE
jgi:hypothetical protein